MYDEKMTVGQVEAWAKTASTEELTEAIEIESGGKARKGAIAALRAALKTDLDELIDAMTPDLAPVPAEPPLGELVTVEYIPELVGKGPDPLPASTPPQPPRGSVRWLFYDSSEGRRLEINFLNDEDQKQMKAPSLTVAPHAAPAWAKAFKTQQGEAVIDLSAAGPVGVKAPPLAKASAPAPVAAPAPTHPPGSRAAAAAEKAERDAAAKALELSGDARKALVTEGLRQRQTRIIR